MTPGNDHPAAHDRADHGTPSDRPSTDAPEPSWMSLPNILTLARFPLALLFVIVDGVALRFLIVIVAGITDWIDGPIARRRGSDSRLGALLDPIADKTFVVVAVATVVIAHGVPWWVLALLLTRDIGVLLGSVVQTARGRRAWVPSRPAGKVVTWLQFMAVGTILLWPEYAGLIAPFVAVAGLVALIDYARAATAPRG